MIKKLTTGILIAAAACACGGGGNTRNSADERPGALEMPSIPAGLTDPQLRADWLNIHFWDRMDWEDTSLSLDTAFMEQSFSNYVSIMPIASDSAMRAGVANLLDAAAAASPEVYDYVMSVADHYLYQADSPFMDERLYRPFMEYALRRNPDDPMAAGRLDDIARNAPGSTAPPFAVEGRDGRAVSLFDHGPQTGTVLMFYEPDCDRCLAAINAFAASERLTRAIADGVIRMIAVYIGSDRDAWREHAASLPDSWLVGIDSDGVIDSDELYMVRATPSFYVIAPDNTIILKDASPARTAEALGL